MATTNEERKRYVREYIRSLVAIEEARSLIRIRSVTCELNFVKMAG